jgi:CRP-like cAMP-binding protein
LEGAANFLHISDSDGEHVTASAPVRAKAQVNVELLKGLKPEELDLVLKAGRRREYSAKKLMTRQGEPTNEIKVLLHGRARYFYESTTGKKLILNWITPGQTFAGIAALSADPHFYPASTETLRDSVVLFWDGPTLRTLAHRFPLILENAVVVATDRHIAWHLAAHVALCSESARERVAHILLALAPLIGEKSPDGIELDITNEELADSANITPYTTSRLISEWQRTGALLKRRGRILVRSPERFFPREAPSFR